MSLLEYLDGKINRGEIGKRIHLTEDMCQQLLREDLQRYQDGAKELRFSVDFVTGEQLYRGIPIKIIGTGAIG